MHTAESDLVIKSTNADIPKFNSFLYYEDKTEIGKIDEIFGPINEVVCITLWQFCHYYILYLHFRFILFIL